VEFWKLELALTANVDWHSIVAITKNRGKAVEIFPLFFESWKYLNPELGPALYPVSSSSRMSSNLIPITTEVPGVKDGGQQASPPLSGSSQG
jgi:hypothetical protein